MGKVGKYFSRCVLYKIFSFLLLFCNFFLLIQDTSTHFEILDITSLLLSELYILMVAKTAENKGAEQLYTDLHLS